MTPLPGESQPVPLPDLLASVASLGEQAQAKLAQWGVAADSPTRLEQAVAELRTVVNRGALAPTHAAIAPALRAIWVAADFADIAEYLPESRVRSLRQELSTALRGDLWPADGQRQPLQFQTQHWIGAVLLHNGLELEHIAFSAKRPVKIPEFFVLNGTSRIGVEVKRPQSVSRIPTIVTEAMAKFAPHHCYGAIVLELTDCITATNEADFALEGSRLMKAAHETVWDSVGNDYRSGFSQLLYLGGVARGAWDIPAADSTRLRLMGHAWHQGYSRHQGTLHGLRSVWIQEQFNLAFQGVVNRLDELSSGSRLGA